MIWLQLVGNKLNDLAVRIGFSNYTHSMRNVRVCEHSTGDLKLDWHYLVSHSLDCQVRKPVQNRTTLFSASFSAISCIACIYGFVWLVKRHSQWTISPFYLNISNHIFAVPYVSFVGLRWKNTHQVNDWIRSFGCRISWKFEFLHRKIVRVNKWDVSDR